MMNALTAIEKHLEKVAEVGMKIEVQATVDKKMAELFEREVSLSLQKSMTEQESQAGERSWLTQPRRLKILSLPTMLYIPLVRIRW